MRAILYALLIGCACVHSFHDGRFLYDTGSIVYRAQPRVNRADPRPGGAPYRRRDATPGRRTLDRGDRAGAPGLLGSASDVCAGYDRTRWQAVHPRDRYFCERPVAAAVGRHPAALLAEIQAYNKRWVDRTLHRGEHLDEVDTALKG